MPKGYSISDYGAMVTNHSRMTAYAESLAKAVRPGSFVIDIGAGFGIFSLLACKFGAEHVAAIEPDPSIEVLGNLAEDNGYDDRITIFKGMSTDFLPARKADVLISDLRGSLPYFEFHIESIVDARQRLLKPSGRMLAQRDILRVALICSEEISRYARDPWSDGFMGLSLSGAETYATSNLKSLHASPNDLLSEPRELATIDYRTVISPNLSGAASLTALEAKRAHGVLVWFDAEVDDGFGFSNAPGEEQLVYGQTFFPFVRTLELKRGEEVEIDVTADFIDNSYVWSWKTYAPGQGDGKGIRFSQSSFTAAPISKARLAQRKADFVPKRGKQHARDVFILSQLDGRNSIGEIAEVVRREFADDELTAKDALDVVSSLAAHYLD